MEHATTTTLFAGDGHRNLLLPDFSAGEQAVQSNQHMIVHGGAAIVLDPGGHKVYSKVLGEVFANLGRASLQAIVLSHQDPDVVAAINGWLTTTDAVAYAPSLWTRFIPHFGLDRLVAERLRPVPDEGMWIELGGAPLVLLPAHFLHSCGNIQLYDPTARILYTGDLGTSLGQPYRVVPDFDAHLPYIEGCHRRYMTSSAILRAWADMVRELDVEIIAPQHGAVYQGKDMVGRFVDWCAELECGIDLIAARLRVPPAP